jgi:hypothetical protein
MNNISVKGKLLKAPTIDRENRYIRFCIIDGNKKKVNGQWIEDPNNMTFFWNCTVWNSEKSQEAFFNSANMPEKCYIKAEGFLTKSKGIDGKEYINFTVLSLNFKNDPY